jgi:hypothetical protein
MIEVSTKWNEYYSHFPNTHLFTQEIW